MSRGGPRPGAGPAKRPEPSKVPAKVASDIRAAAKSARLTPLEYMLGVLNDETADEARRDRMAQAAAPYVHARPLPAGEGGKKGEAQAAAATAGAGSDWGDDLTYRAPN